MTTNSETDPPFASPHRVSIGMTWRCTCGPVPTTPSPDLLPPRQRRDLRAEHPRAARHGLAATWSWWQYDVPAADSAAPAAREGREPDLFVLTRSSNDRPPR